MDSIYKKIKELEVIKHKLTKQVVAKHKEQLRDSSQYQELKYSIENSKVYRYCEETEQVVKTLHFDFNASELQLDQYASLALLELIYEDSSAFYDEQDKEFRINEGEGIVISKGTNCNVYLNDRVIIRSDSFDSNFEMYARINDYQERNGLALPVYKTQSNGNLKKIDTSLPKDWDNV